MQNKPNCPIADFGSRIADSEQTCGGTPSAACRPDPGGSIVRNEPNLPPDRQTRPWLEQIVRNKANCPPGRCRAGTPNPPRDDYAKQSQSRRGRAGRGPGGEGRIVQNKANSVRGSKESSACRETSYGGLDMHGAAAEQSQFTPLPTGTVGGRQGRRWSATGGQSCKTNPIRAGECRHRGERTCETKPIRPEG